MMRIIHKPDLMSLNPNGRLLYRLRGLRVDGVLVFRDLCLKSEKPGYELTMVIPNRCFS